MVKFKQWNCEVEFGEYSNGRIAIELVDPEPIAVATVNLPDVVLKDDEVIIKDYSENEGVLDALVEAGYVSKPIDWVRTGFVTCPICKLLKKDQEVSIIFRIFV
jgi:hypothetical protein